MWKLVAKSMINYNHQNPRGSAESKGLGVKQIYFCRKGKYNSYLQKEGWWKDHEEKETMVEIQEETAKVKDHLRVIMKTGYSRSISKYLI